MRMLAPVLCLKSRIWSPPRPIIIPTAPAGTVMVLRSVIGRSRSRPPLRRDSIRVLMSPLHRSICSFVPISVTSLLGDPGRDSRAIWMRQPDSLCKRLIVSPPRPINRPTSVFCILISNSSPRSRSSRSRSRSLSRSPPSRPPRACSWRCLRRLAFSGLRTMSFTIWAPLSTCSFVSPTTNTCSGSSGSMSLPSLADPRPRIRILAPDFSWRFFCVEPRGPINNPRKLMSG
mmetsp:Transcript_13035/g.20690  ORF Transcript_13035/g.20690 Transcript_13035/m.20690 type:complete len:231 (+) Transcript_13035:197-889(+)